MHEVQFWCRSLLRRLLSTAESYSSHRCTARDMAAYVPGILAAGVGEGSEGDEPMYAEDRQEHRALCDG